jgi:hypothetical protein
MSISTAFSASIPSMFSDTSTPSVSFGSAVSIAATFHTAIVSMISIAAFEFCSAILSPEVES